MTGHESAIVGPVDAGNARFAEIYTRYFRHVYAYCRRRTDPGRVDDAVADVFLVTWRKIDDVPNEPATLPWLYGVGYRVLSQQWRTASRQRNLTQKLHAVGIEPLMSTDELVVTRHEADDVFRALSLLRPGDQEVLRLSVWEDLPHRIVAEILGVSEEVVRKRLSRARKKLTHEFNRLSGGSSPAAQKGGAW
jgi:RNA polymerase sigma-70 factor, ECF subfamily